MEQNLYIGITGIFLKSGRLGLAEDSLNKSLDYNQKINAYSDPGYLYNLMELQLLREEKRQAYETMQKLLEHEMYKSLLFFSGLMKHLLYMGKMTPGACREVLPDV